jgi:serine/threonine protein kinase
MKDNNGGTANVMVLPPSDWSLDPDTGFPSGALTEMSISVYWQGQHQGQHQGRHQRQQQDHGEVVAVACQHPLSLRVPYAVLAAATAGFDDACCIGGGGSCAVYKAMVYGTWVAVKALKLRSGDGSEEAARSEARQFAAEMALLTSVQHPNICRLLGVSTDGARRCLVLEHCPGGGLDKRLKHDRGLLASGYGASLGWGQRLQIAVGIARALAHLHSLKPAMIHRDVKTQNVLLAREHCGGSDTDGNDWLANTKVADFGTVREDKREKVDSTLDTEVVGNFRTHGVTQNIVGTLPYMPIEYTFGQVGPKTDAFSYGILLIELLTSRDGVGARTLVLSEVGYVCLRVLLSYLLALLAVVLLVV